MSCTCSIVPPHLLEGIAASEHNPQHVRDSARATLEHHHQLAALRKEHLERYPRSHTGPSPSSHDGGFIPKHLLDHLAASEAVRPADDVPVPAQTPAEVSSQESKVLVTPTDVTDQPEAAASVPVGTTLSPGSSTIQQPSTASVPQALYPANASPISRVYDAQNATDKAKLPGALISIPPSADRAALEAYTNITTVLAAYRSLFNWKSLDNQDATVTGSVHYGIGIQNAYWDRTQLLFGDGGTLLYNFTNCLDVIGHELQHAVTQNTCGLAYEGQSGALNEHLSDVFGIIFLQYKGSIKAREAKWLIGEGCLMPKVDGVALRSMKDPGTAYKDDRLGKDPQVGNMKDFLTLPTIIDKGGVHLNSGIPNKAFYLAAVAFDGYSWEKAGQIWWKTVLSGLLAPKCTFSQFATATVKVANSTFDGKAAQVVKNAWDSVGVQLST